MNKFYNKFYHIGEHVKIHDVNKTLPWYCETIFRIKDFYITKTGDILCKLDKKIPNHPIEGEENEIHILNLKKDEECVILDRKQKLIEIDKSGI